MNTVPVYILAGGRSSRFGTDKALAQLDGQPLIARVAAMAQPRATRVTVVARELDQYSHLGLRTIPDLRPGLGPLAGLHAALGDCTEHAWLLLLSCDLLHLKVAWIDALLAHRRYPPERWPAVAFKPDSWQPLLGVYHTSVASRVKSLLDAHQLAMQPMLDEVACIASPLPADWPRTLQANRPEELLKG